MKEILKQYAAYNSWANQRITDAVLGVDPALQKQVVSSSFSTLIATLKHMWDVESIWWQRIKLVENVTRPTEAEVTTDVCSGLLRQSKLWEEWVEKGTEAAFEHEFIYRNNKKEQVKLPVYQLLMQLFNHQTYHRGQLVTMLRTLGTVTIPSTDFLEFTWRKK